ncbi:hypothetical protein Poly21_32530 [Allorhodopirellula heiligendammensis]|uniref:Uncharacterized protein n=2 Tax=Allorhodopirellula heiligendammensis TaxID=2714739 RepID=A0A5C6BVG1_9BACT|nr:hypothetical protein Poly21_32530 [Allorhodopirellula heiligendammensis]
MPRRSTAGRTEHENTETDGHTGCLEGSEVETRAALPYGILTILAIIKHRSFHHVFPGDVITSHSFDMPISAASKLTRRQAMSGLSAAASLAAFGSVGGADSLLELPPTKQLTHGGPDHWFGYYDKLEFDPADRFVLANEVNFSGRTPTADDVIGVGMVDTQADERWIPLGSSHAWGWQQGCMLQWRPGSASEVMWNDRQENQHVCRLLDVKTKKLRTLPRPIYALSPDGKYAITADFARIQRMRPGYGYVGLPDPSARQRAPEESGVWRMEIETGKTELIFSLADAAKIDYNGQSLADKWNYFNHLLVSPDGTRFIVLHRWRNNEGEGDNARPVGGFSTRMFTVNMDGSERYILDPSGHTSHFIWRDPKHVCAWTKPVGKPAAFYLLKDQTQDIQVVGEGVMATNGHNTYVPHTDNEWILNDTYPLGKNREQNPYLYHVPTNRRVSLGKFPAPPQFTGEWRCDTHPRSSNDGRSVVIDSAHSGGRQMYQIDISGIVNA